MILLTTIAMSLWLAQVPATEQQDWRAQFEAGRQAYARQQFAEAVRTLTAAAESARTVPDNAAAVLELSRMLASAHREMGNHAEAEQVLRRASLLWAVNDPHGIKLAQVLEELTAAQRAQGHTADALGSLAKAIEIRELNPDAPRTDLARDLTAAALLRYKLGEMEPAMEGLRRAIAEWDAASPGDPQALPAVEALAGAYREQTDYAAAEPLLFRSLRAREAVNGPDSGEVISAVDSLAYVEFGLKKFAEAELQYKRLLDLWINNGGPDHPMVALTYDKMAEFYAFQQRYAEAEKCATESLAMRGRMHLASLNQTGRILLMEAKLPDAEDLYSRAIKIGDLANAPETVLDPVLRVYAQILREMKRMPEANAIDGRVKEAILHRGDREGRRDPAAPSRPPAK